MFQGLVTVFDWLTVWEDAEVGALNTTAEERSRAARSLFMGLWVHPAPMAVNLRLLHPCALRGE